jgi:uncharacterized LabA/DUF88 family protein
MSDVSIAVEMIFDAIDNKFDIALLISADSDQVPLLKGIMARDDLKDKRIMVAVPPKRYSDDLRGIAYHYLHLDRVHFANSLLPPKVKRDDGFILERPIEWC